MVRDPSSVGLLAVVVVPVLLSFMCAVLRAWVTLAVERERQATMRLAIGSIAGSREPGSPSPSPGACGRWGSEPTGNYQGEDGR